MHGDADTDRGRRRPGLGEQGLLKLDRRDNRVSGALEDREMAVAFAPRTEQAAGVPRDNRRDKRVMAG